MKNLKWLLVPVVVLVSFVAYGQLLSLLAEIFPIPEDKSNLSYVLMMVSLPSFLASVTVSSFVAYFLAFVFKQKATLVSVLVPLPVLFFSLPEFSDFQSPSTGTLVVMYEVFTYSTLIIAGTWLAHRQLAGSNPTVKRDAP